MREIFGRFSTFGLAQGVSSLGNFVLSLIITRTLPQSEFGAAALALTFGFFALAAQRAIIGDPTLAHRAEPPSLLRSMSTLSWLTAPGAGVAITVVFFPFLGRTSLAIGIATLLLVAQDGYRYIAAANEHHKVTLKGDFIWLTFGIASLALTIPSSRHFELSFAVWAAGGSASLLYLIWKTRHYAYPFGSPRSFFRITRQLSSWAALQFLIANGAMQATLSIMAVGIGLHDYAGFRAVQVAVSPLQVTILALSSPLLSVIARRATPSDLRRVATTVSLTLLTGTTLVSAFAWWYRGDLISVVAGSSYEKYAPLVAPALISVIFVAANMPVTAALQTQRRGRTLFLVSSVTVVAANIPICFAAYTAPVVTVAWIAMIQYPAIFFALGTAFLRRGSTTSDSSRFDARGLGVLAHDVGDAGSES